MGIYLNPGNRMFQMALDSKFYVDKTGIASFMNERIGRDGRFVCVSRPRRFGKSTDADMLVAYYSRGARSAPLFESLAVSKTPAYGRHLNAHDVVKVNVQGMISRGSGGIAGISETITAEVLEELRATWPGVLPDGLGNLPKALELVEASKGSGFIFIIDEWDCIFRIAPTDEDAQQRYLEFLRDLLKDRTYVDACYMTGILPIRKYGKHSALNLFTEYSMTDPKGLDSLFGFNADEVERLCARFDMDSAQMRHWYDGYLLGGGRLHVYNPRSVAGAIIEGHYSSFWTDTETYEALQMYIDMDFDGVATDLVAMLDGQRIPADVSGFDNTMTGFRDKDDLYALLVHLGYLGYDVPARSVFIPNEEIRREFATSLRTGRRPQLARLVGESRELLRRTLAGDASYVADAMERAHSSAAGPHYYNDEQALRAAVKLAYIWAIDDYLRVDELPGGRGYADVAFIPKKGSPLPPLLVELKWNRDAGAAISQIHQKGYPESLRGLGGECVLVGVTYDEGSCEHSCSIERVALA